MLQSFLFKIKDHRRAQPTLSLGPPVVVLDSGDSERSGLLPENSPVHPGPLRDPKRVVWVELETGPRAYDRARDYSNTSSADLEDQFRAYSAALAMQDTLKPFVGFDGKVLPGSFDHFRDHQAIQS